MSLEFDFCLPWPPSVNTYYRMVGSRMLMSARGRAYAAEAHKLIMLQRVTQYGKHDRLRVTIQANPPDRRKRDLDNLLKSILDSLEKSGVFFNDNQVDDLRIFRGDIEKPGQLLIKIERIF